MTLRSPITDEDNIMPGVEACFTRDQVARHLNVTARSVDYWISSGHLASVRIGASPRVRASELDRAVREGLPTVQFDRNKPRRTPGGNSAGFKTSLATPSAN